MLRLADEFCGGGGSMTGFTAVPYVQGIWAANHDQVAIDTHAANFPDVEHYRGDIEDADLTKVPPAELFWASPVCPPWTDARGRRRDFDRSTQPPLFGPHGPDPATARGRALMEQVPRYLRAMNLRGRPVLAGVVENVIQCRAWDQWRRWVREIEAEGYVTRLIAFNSMHARPRFGTPMAPQSRDRLYLVFWHRKLGRTPDFDKWLRPTAWCARCEATVLAMQVFKRPGVDMGRYRAQWAYRCPNATCRHHTVEPAVLPALAVVDLTNPGRRIGDWASYRPRPYAEATLARIRAGIARYAGQAFTYTAAGHTHEAPGSTCVRAWPLDGPLVTQTTTGTLAVACLPLLVPAGGSWRGHGEHGAAPATAPMPTRTTRETDLLAFAPFIAPLRGGGDRENARPVTGPLATFSAGGQHHLLATPPQLAALVMRNNTPRGNPAHMCSPLTEPIRAITTAGHQSLVTWGHLLDEHGIDPANIDIDDVYARMLTVDEIKAGMAFPATYQLVAGSSKKKVSLLGRAVTPPVAEVLGAALVEAIAGHDLPEPTPPAAGPVHTRETQ